MKLEDRIPLDVSVFPFGDLASAKLYRESRMLTDRDSCIVPIAGAYFLCCWQERYK